MESLEAELNGTIKKVEDLAEYVGHWEVVSSQFSEYIGFLKHPIVKWVLGPPSRKEEIGEEERLKVESASDKAIEEAKNELQNIYDSDKWISARYVAAEFLCIPDEQLERDFEGWIKGLEKNFNRGYKMGNRRAYMDLKYIYNLPRTRRPKRKDHHIVAYDRNEEYRGRAGEALGYGKKRIWGHETFVMLFKGPRMESPFF